MPGKLTLTIEPVIVTFVAAQAFYRVFWKPSAITTVIEEKTSSSPKTVRRNHAQDRVDDGRLIMARPD
jgi:hypothetical protein